MSIGTRGCGPADIYALYVAAHYLRDYLLYGLVALGVVATACLFVGACKVRVPFSLPVTLLKREFLAEKSVLHLGMGRTYDPRDSF